jgi:hypothetical protein
MLLNVFDPVIVNAPRPPWFNVQLNVEPPPANVLADEEVKEIMPVPVPAVVVKFVGVALLNTVPPPVPVQIIDPPLKVRFFVPVAVTNLLDRVTVRLFKSIVPFVSVSIPLFKAVINVQAPPTPLKVTPPVSVTPLVVIVLPVVVALNVVMPV